MKRVLVDAYFYVNVGDDLFVKVLIDRYPHVQWDLLTSDPVYESIFQGYRNVNIIRTLNIEVGKYTYDLFRKINNAFLKYNKYDAYVMIGGSIFMQHGQWEEQLEQRSLLPEMFRRRNKKSFIIGANFGPFTDEAFVQKHRKYFATFDDVCFRDRYSYELFRDLDQVRWAPDVVLNLRTERAVPRPAGKVAGFSVIDLQRRESLKPYAALYQQKMREIAEQYLALGYQVRFFSFCKFEGDLEAARALAEQLASRERVEVIDYREDLASMLERFQECDVIIGTRFHSIILALVYRQAFFPFIYSDKTLHVLQDLQLDQSYCLIQDLQHFNPQDAVHSVIRGPVDEKVINDAEQQFARLDVYLQHTRSREQVGW